MTVSLDSLVDRWEDRLDSRPKAVRVKKEPISPFEQGIFPVNFDGPPSHRAERAATFLSNLGLVTKWHYDDPGLGDESACYTEAWRHPQEGQPIFTLLFNVDGSVEVLTWGVAQ